MIERAIASVADRAAVDWDALEREIDSADDKALLDCLRILGGVGNLHRTINVDTASSDRATLPNSDAGNDTRVPLSSMWGRFRIDQQVGEGGFGRVYRAWDPELEREIAIKILHRRVADSRLRETLLREGRALAKIRHPHVVNVLGVEARGDQVGLCMEFVHGQTLEDALQQHGILDGLDVARVGLDLCGALEAVHRAGFVHRDVKARNVMRDESGRVVLMDFGAGQDTRTMTDKPNAVGTPLYMAPEVLAGGVASASSDIYAVGVLLYHLVTNEYPVQGRTVEELRSAHMLNRRQTLGQRRPDLPAAFVKVIDRSLAADPERRYTTATEFLDALAQVVDDKKITPRMAILTLAARMALGAVLVLAGLAATGAIISREFNSVLGRTEYASETLRGWLAWGATSFVLPVVLTLLAASAIALLFVLRYLLRSMSQRARTLEERILSSLRQAGRSLRLDDHPTCAGLCLLLSSAAIVGSWWYFRGLLGAMFGNVSTASSEMLALLSPNGEDHYLAYRVTFTAVSVLAGLTVYAVSRLIPRRLDLFQRAVWFGSIAVLVLSLFYLSLPYRILRFARFPEVTWNDERCFSLGERTSDVLLFCPARPAPRTVVAQRGADGPTPTGITKNIFSDF